MMAATAFSVLSLMLLAACEGCSKFYPPAEKPGENCTNFGYGKANGPQKWPKFCPTCGGCRQSPIDINSENVIYEPLPELGGTFWDPKRQGAMFILRNINYTVQREPLYRHKLTLEGGPLSSRYVLDHVQFRWGSDDSKGSEHTIGGKRFPFESQITFLKEQYEDFSEAVQKPDGIVKISLLNKISDEDNPALAPLIKAVSNVKSPGSATFSHEKIKISDLLPLIYKDNYYVYAGSLTTPPCTESVLWIVYPPYVVISQAQLATYRKLKSPYGSLVDNFRPTQRLYSRVVRASRRLHSYH